MAKPSEQAEITTITVSRKKVDRYDPDKKVTVTLHGSNLTKAYAIRIRAGVRFNGHDYEGTTNGDGTLLTIENIPVPLTSGVYPIYAQLKPRNATAYTNVYYPQKFRVLGDVVLKELVLSGYKKDFEDQSGTAWCAIIGKNLDSLTSDQLSDIRSSLGATVKKARIQDSTFLSAEYVFPAFDDDSVIGKTETLTIAGKEISAPLHTLDIKNYDYGYTVSDYYSIPSDGKVRIPNYVTYIGNHAFAGCSELTEVTLPASLISIEKGAFSGCTKLERADLAATKLTGISSATFYGCAGLTEVKLPATISSIGEQAFRGCNALTSAVFADTAGWAVYDDEHYNTKRADIQKDELAKAAEYLGKYSGSGDYTDKHWKKN